MSSHRGLSAVVGTVFLIAVVIGALSYVSYSLEMMGNFSESLISEESRQKDKQSEAFEISSIDVTASDKLDGVIKNTGEIPVKITTLWIDEQGVNDVVQKFDVDAEIAQGQTVDLSNLVDFTIDPIKGYNMKMVTNRGESKSFSVNSASSNNLWMQLTGVPNSIPSTFETTLLYTVVNNMTSGNNLYNLTPELTVDTIGSASGSPVGVNPSPASYPVLGPGEVATFRYVYSITGDADSGLTFTASLLNGVSGNEASTTVLIKDVTLATEAGTALQSFGLANELAATEDIMFFHDDAFQTPNGEYQMDGSDPNGAGTSMSPQEGNLTFISAPMIQSEYVVESGYPWNSTVQYFSNLVPSTVTDPDLAFFMDCDACGGSSDTIESVGHVAKGGDKGRLHKGGGSDTPTFFSTGGPFNDGYYSFAGDRMEADWNVDGGTEGQYSNPQSCCDSTAAWVRIPNVGSDSYMSIIWFGDGDHDSDSYALSVGNRWDSGDKGKAVFHYATEDWDKDITDCVSNSRIDDNAWHFIVGVRNAEDNCILYVDGVEQTDKDTTCCDNTSIVDINEIGVGWDRRSSSTELTGDIALIMHWNDHVLSQQEVTDLYNTNYGESAHTLQVSIDKTDSAGVITDNFLTEDVSIDFQAPGIFSPTSGNNINFLTDNSTDDKYGPTIFKSYVVGNKTLATDEHLLYTLSDVSSEELGIVFRMDDNTMGTPSYLHTAPVDPDWPTFLIIKNDDLVTYIAYNEGPNGVWFNYQGTRMVLTTADGLTSFGSIIKQINGTAINADQDSIYFPADTYAELEFWQLASPPQGPPGPNQQDYADPGDYNAAVFLSGYDESGEVFLRSIKLGLIHIIQ